MAIKIIDIRDGEEKDEVTQIRYTYDNSGGYWYLNDDDNLFFCDSEGNSHITATGISMPHFLAMINIIGQEITFRRLKREDDSRKSIDDDIPF